MAHLKRSDLPDGFFHVYARGVCGIGPIFVDREDHETSSGSFGSPPDDTPGSAMPTA